MRERLRAAIAQRTADFLEIRWEEEDILAFSLSGTTVEESSQSQNRVGNVRALVNGGWGFVPFHDPNSIDQAVAQAIEQAALANNANLLLAEAKAIVDTVRAPQNGDPRSVSLPDKLALVKHYAQVALDYHPAVVNVLSSYQENFQRRYYLNSSGSDIEQEKCYLNATFTVVAREQGVLETYSVGIRSVSGYNDLLDHEDELRAAAERAVEIVRADLVAGGQYTVVLDSGMTGLFIHEAFGHLSEADGIFENKQLQQLMALGSKIGPDILTVSDGAVIPDLHGSYKYDDEGTPAGKTKLITAGVLTGRLHNRETAGAMGEPAVGNARAISYQYPPLVRMTNTCVEPGESSFAEMTADIPLGIYIRGIRGGTTMKEMFTFAPQEAFMIRNGQMAERVRGVAMMGNVFETLQNIDRVGNDFTWHFSGCSKGGQGMLQVGMGGPSIRIQNVVVGGK